MMNDVFRIHFSSVLFHAINQLSIVTTCSPVSVVLLAFKLNQAEG